MKALERKSVLSKDNLTNPY